MGRPATSTGGDGIELERTGRGAYRLTSAVTVSRPLEAVFPFFSDAHNLERLTPPWLSFRVVTPGPIAIAPGARIDYRLRVRGLPIRWTSEIGAWEPPHRFTDCQVRGPYRRWLHEHTFGERDGATLVGDDVEFEVRGGSLAGRVVAGDVRRIFEYRRDRLHELFAA
jgi:ligand-binding SRPBCC domain-containing protein